MNRRWKIALAALLGFSTACSTVKQAPVEEPKPERGEADSTATTREGEFDGTLQPSEANLRPRIRLMYGVPSPRPSTDEKEQPAEETLSQPDIAPESGSDNRE